MTTTRARRRAARRQEILDAAMNLVVEDGLDALTISRLAKEVDAAVGAIYRYFTGKPAVIAELQIAAVQTLAEQLDETFEGAEPALAELEPTTRALARILVAFSTWPAFAERHPALYRLVDRSVSDPRRILDDESAASVDAAILPVLGRCATLLDDAASAGALHPGDSATRSFSLWAALHGVGHFKKRDTRMPENLRSAVLGEELMRTLLHGWGADGELLSQAWQAASDIQEASR